VDILFNTISQQAVKHKLNMLPSQPKRATMRKLSLPQPQKPVNRVEGSNSNSGKLIDININADSYKHYISLLQESIDEQDQRNDTQMILIKHVTKQYSQQLEDCGYEEGTLHNLMAKIPKSNSELTVKNQ
jgi:hypothetical protein